MPTSPHWLMSPQFRIVFHLRVCAQRLLSVAYMSYVYASWRVLSSLLGTSMTQCVCLHNLCIDSEGRVTRKTEANKVTESEDASPLQLFEITLEPPEVSDLSTETLKETMWHFEMKSGNCLIITLWLIVITLIFYWIEMSFKIFFVFLISADVTGTWQSKTTVTTQSMNFWCVLPKDKVFMYFGSESNSRLMIVYSSLVRQELFDRPVEYLATLKWVSFIPSLC